jgi:DNA repair exonuclease SbcCD ATPase subunit
MAEKQDDPTLEEDPIEDGTQDDQTKALADAGNETDWKVSYQGLQKVVSKKDTTITKLSSQIEDLSTQLEALKNESGTTAKAKADAENALQAARTSLEEITSERDTLQSQLDRQKLINDEFSELGPMAKYVPEGETLEEFQANAKAFLEDLNSRTSTQVQQTLAGSSPDTPAGEGDDIVFDQNEADRLWDLVEQTAGVVGKEKEFNEANAALQKLMAVQNRN